MQGWGSQYGLDAKKKALFKTISGLKPGNTIVMLQECGNPETTGLTQGEKIKIDSKKNFYCNINYPDPSADALRCSTAILGDEKLGDISGEAFFPQGVSRPVVCVEVGNICFATIHAIANQSYSISEVKASLCLLAEKYERWILMGDFNSEPSDYTSEKPKPEKLNSVTIGGTESRPGLECKMIFSKKATQGPDGGRNRNFDFAFVSKNFSDDNFLPFSESGTKVSNTQQTTPGSHYLSDHNLIGVRLSLPE